MKLIKRFVAWLNEPDPILGCPDPELHDKNSEEKHADVIQTAIGDKNAG